MSTWSRQSRNTPTWSRGQKSGIIAEIWSSSYYPWAADVYPWQNETQITETVWSRQTKH